MGGHSAHLSAREQGANDDDFFYSISHEMILDSEPFSLFKRDA